MSDIARRTIVAGAAGAVLAPTLDVVASAASQEGKFTPIPKAATSMFRLGDVVQLNSGGPLMTVQEVTSVTASTHASTTVLWASGTGAYFISVDPAMLHLAGMVPATPHWK